jgi:ornithine--oxo-acid transaminase
MKTQEYIDLEERLGAHNYHPLDVVIERGAGVWVWDVEGHKYLDMLAAYGAVNQGHCHPKIVATMIEQAPKLALTSRAFRNDQLPGFYKTLTEMVGYDKVLPMNTGAEAVETAIKVARKWAYEVKGVAQDQAEILVFSENFHGRTTTIISFSTDEQTRASFGPFPAGFRILPYGDADALTAAMNPNVAAIMIEPIQGEGGIIVPPEGFLRHLRALCDEHNALFIADEIQSGLGRTGRLLAVEHEGVRPDIVILGKALSGGMYPVSAIVADDAVMNVLKPGDHGSTYGGNPLGARVAVTALEVLRDEKLIENSDQLGRYALERLQALDTPNIKEVRGRGLWIGIELNPEAGGARRFCEALMQRGLLCKETHTHTIRLAPPLTITREELDWALDHIETVLADAPVAAAIG